MRSEYKWGEVLHTLSSEVTCPRGYKTQIDGSINLDSAHFVVTSSLQHEGERYATRFSYDLEPDQGHAETDFDLVIPSRHVVAKAEVTSRSDTMGASASVKWDADGDRSRKVVVDALLTMIDGRHTGAFMFVCPGSRTTASLEQEVTDTTLTHHSQLTFNDHAPGVVDVTVVNRLQLVALLAPTAVAVRRVDAVLTLDVTAVMTVGTLVFGRAAHVVPRIAARCAPAQTCQTHSMRS